jgi:hypothetical protein
MGRGFLGFGAIATCSIQLELARWDDSNGVEHSVIVPKPIELTSNMRMVEERLSWAQVFGF